MNPFISNTEHLQAELEWLDLLLRRQVLRLRAARLFNEDPLHGLYVSDAQVDALLEAGSGAPDGAAEGVQGLTARMTALRAEIRRCSDAAGRELRLPRLARLFALSGFEAEALVVALAPALDLKYQSLYAYVQNDVTRKHPTVGLVLDLLCTSFEERQQRRAGFAAEAALFRNRLLHPIRGPQREEPGLLQQPIAVEEGVVAWLLGNDALDPMLHACARRIQPAWELSGLLLPDALRAALTRLAASGEPAVVWLQGPRGVGKKSVAEAVCRERGLPLIVLDAAEALASEAAEDAMAGVLAREARLGEAAVFIDGFETLLAEEGRPRRLRAALARALSGLAGPVFLGSCAPGSPDPAWTRGRFLRFDLALPEFADRLSLWQRAAGDGVALADLRAVAGKFILSGGQVLDAMRLARDLAWLRADPAPGLEDLHAAARAQSNPALKRLAQKVEPVYAWDDLVLPPQVLRQLREVCASLNYRAMVYSEWGFDRRLAMGKGLNVLFSGASGTGKTMAAQCLARDLGLDLYRIDLSAVVSKYIGETEKNLSAIFREAQASNAILFFDEADALFGKRSEVKDAHDRYANIEVAYLLQKMEEYEGVVILATNLSGNMDAAFARRMHHVLEFPFPDAALRARLWHRQFPPAAPLAEDVDLGFLATRFELAGGNIRNVGLAAAFMAAAAGEPIRMQHLLLATSRELQKIGKLPGRSEFGEFYELVRASG